MKGHSLPGIKQRVEALKPGPPQNVDKDGLYVKPGPDKNLVRPIPPKPRVNPNINPATGLYYPLPGGAEGNTSKKYREKGGAPMMGSSPVKQDNIKWGDEKQTSKTVTPNDKGGENTKTTYETKGTSYTPPNKTPKGDLAYKKLTPKERKIQDDKYIAANTKKHVKNREEVDATKKNMVKIPKLPTKPLQVEQKEEPQKAKLPKYTKITNQKPGLFKRGQITVTNNEKGTSSTSRTSSRTGEVAKNVGKFVKNIIPTKKFKNCRKNKKNYGSTKCPF